ncbi:MAG: endonuclease III [Marinifilaceae bacterium]|jgi:endonuclease-3|nr:endonuclease III [Marinilabiliaceae bacterium JC040]MCT4599306.1 endonuclease III [Marinifilaceae bacterium]
MTIKERYEGVIAWFSKTMPEAVTELNYNNPFELLVAVILSAQCTDKRVNIVTPDLFKKYPDSYTMSRAEQSEIFEYIKSVTFPNNKAKHLKEMSRMLVSDYEGEVPRDIEEMQKLPGVGRKTANVMAVVVFDIPAMPVDTHVFRVSERIGLSKGAKTPLDTEKQLVKRFPQSLLAIAHHWLILHGRYVCKARKPLCENCGLHDFCLYYKTHNKK